MRTLRLCSLDFGTYKGLHEGAILLTKVLRLHQQACRGPWGRTHEVRQYTCGESVQTWSGCMALRPCPTQSKLLANVERDRGRSIMPSCGYMHQRATSRHTPQSLRTSSSASSMPRPEPWLVRGPRERRLPECARERDAARDSGGLGLCGRSAAEPGWSASSASCSVHRACQ